MPYEVEIKVLGGLRVIVQYDRHWNWKIVGVAGRYIKNARWIERRVNDCDVVQQLQELAY